jgi:protein required for attachment to host cells
MKPIITWVLIADGAQARVYENSGSGKGLVPVDGLDFSIPALQAREIMADRPGRAYASAGYGRSAYAQQTDPVEYREEEFVKSVAAVLDQKKAEGAYDRLVIAAAPTALGYIRPALTPAVRKSLMAELHKDLTNVPPNTLGKHFESVFAV